MDNQNAMALVAAQLTAALLAQACNNGNDHKQAVGMFYAMIEELEEQRPKGKNFVF